MPTTAIYVVLSVVLAPALVDMGISPMAAHLFIFYFGLLSFLTPPVAVASYVAAGLAGSGMWSTSWQGVKLATMAYILPFVWCYNPALILEGGVVADTYAIGTALLAALLIARGMQGRRLNTPTGALVASLFVVGAVVVGASTIMFGAESPINLVTAGSSAAVLIAIRWLARKPA
jgi:TRAP-type uncharacterized transport system fused permease subunit